MPKDIFHKFKLIFKTSKASNNKIIDKIASIKVSKPHFFTALLSPQKKIEIKIAKKLKLISKYPQKFIILPP